jgi:hypothetical protein
MKRDLGAFERLYWLFNQWSPNNVVAVCELDGWLEPARLARALGALVQRHPALGHRILADRAGRHPRLIGRQARGVPLELHMGTTFSRDALVTHELNAALDAEVSLARAVYAQGARGSLLLLTCLHVIADATSVMLALRELLARYEADDAGDTEPRLPLPSPELSLPRRARGLRAAPLLATTQLSALWRSLRHRPARLPAQRALAAGERRNAYLQRMFAPQPLAAMQRACRDHAVSLHGLLCAALALSIADELGLRQARRAALNLGSPISFRDALEPPVGPELGSYVCTLGLCLEVGRGATLWSVARAVNTQIAARREAGEDVATLALIERATPATFAASSGMARFAEQHGPGNACLSNIGTFELPERVADIGVRAAHWVASLSVTGYVLCAVTRNAHGLSLDFAYLEGMVSRERAQRIVDGMSAQLAAYVQEPAHELQSYEVVS